MHQSRISHQSLDRPHINSCNRQASNSSAPLDQLPSFHHLFAKAQSNFSFAELELTNEKNLMLRSPYWSHCTLDFWCQSTSSWVSTSFLQSFNFFSHFSRLCVALLDKILHTTQSSSQFLISLVYIPKYIFVPTLEHFSRHFYGILPQYPFLPILLCETLKIPMS